MPVSDARCTRCAAFKSDRVVLRFDVLFLNASRSYTDDIAMLTPEPWRKYRHEASFQNPGCRRQ
jgi:hypothetical protein